MKTIKDIREEALAKLMGLTIIVSLGLFSLWQVSKLNPLAAWIICTWLCLRQKNDPHRTM